MPRISTASLFQVILGTTLQCTLVACNSGGQSAPGAGAAAGGTTAPTGSAIVTWSAPQTNADGSVLTNLLGFRVYYGTNANVLASLRDVPGAAASDTEFTKLAPGTYYFAVTAYTADGAESELSAVVSKDVI